MTIHCDCCGVNIYDERAIKTISYHNPNGGLPDTYFICLACFHSYDEVELKEKLKHDTETLTNPRDQFKAQTGMEAVYNGVWNTDYVVWLEAQFNDPRR